ncbi:hypothetical protein CPB83DRAFT_847645, partial [Crepidotus variabilis]
MEDTDTLLALVYSLIPSNQQESIKQHDALQALISSNGNVEDAVQLLLTKSCPGASRSVTKRKRGDLDSWLKLPSKKIQTETLDNPSKDEILDATSSKPLLSKPKSPNRSKLPVDLMAVLRQPPSPRKGPVQLPPMTLSTPEMVAKHTPCTLHYSILPPELACQLFYSMIDLSKGWKKNKWWLFDRVVESPHLTSFFARQTDGLDDDVAWQEAAQFWYNGRPTDPPSKFSPEMEEACQYIEKTVNEVTKTRPRFKKEWGGGFGDPHWRANVAASNCYQGGKESVGFHSDQLTYLGPYPTIASLSLGTRRTFTLREVVPNEQTTLRKAQTFNIPLPHNSLTIMHASCQERFKHSIPPQNAVDLFRPAFPRAEGEGIDPSNCRINITFRFYRPDFRPASIPRCRCNVPCILRPDMKNRDDEETDRYWWACYAGAQNDGMGCKFWKVMDMETEGRTTHLD